MPVQYVIHFGSSAQDAAQQTSNTIAASHPDKPPPPVTALAKLRTGVAVVPTQTGTQLVSICCILAQPCRASMRKAASIMTLGCRSAQQAGSAQKSACTDPRSVLQRPSHLDEAVAAGSRPPADVERAYASACSSCQHRLRLLLKALIWGWRHDALLPTHPHAQPPVCPCLHARVLARWCPHI